MSKKKKKIKKMSTKQRIIVTLGILVALVAIGFMGYYMLMNYKPANEHGVEISNFISVLEEVSTDCSDLSDDCSSNNSSSKLDKTDISEKQMNILCLAFDEASGNSDVMMLLNVDFIANKVNVLQIPRDSYIGTDGCIRMNSAYHYGDPDLAPINRTIKQVNEQFKLTVDRYVTVELEGFRAIVDGIGGIEMDVPETIYYDSLHNKVLYAGPQTLSGNQAEWFVRYRAGYIEGDTGRVKAQRLFLAAAVNKVKQISVLEIINMIPTIRDNVKTDMSVGDMKKLAETIAKVDMENMTIHMVPGEGVSIYPDGQRMDVWSMHKDTTADMLNEYFRPYHADVPAEELGIDEISNKYNFYEDTHDNLQDLIDGDEPGQKKDVDE